MEYTAISLMHVHGVDKQNLNFLSYFVKNDWRRGRNKEPGERKANNNIQFV